MTSFDKENIFGVDESNVTFKKSSSLSAECMASFDKENIFGVDESNVTFMKSSSLSAGCCKRYFRMTLLCFPTVLSLLCFVGVVVFGVLYFRFAEERIVSLQNETSSLIGQFSEANATQPCGGDSSNVLDRIASLQNEMSALLDQFSELTVQLNASQSLIQQLNITISDDSDLVSVQQQLTQTMANVQQLNMTISDDSDLVSVQQQLTQTMANVQQLNMTISDDSDLVSVQ